MNVFARGLRLPRPLLMFLAVGWIGSTTEADSVPFKVGVFKQEIARSYTTEHGLDSNDVKEIYVARNGLIYARSDKGWNVFDHELWSPVERVPTTQLQGYFSQNEFESIPGQVRQAVRLQDESVIASADDGLWRITPEGAKQIRIHDGLGRAWAVSDVRALALDKQGQLWIATQAGVVEGRDGDWQFYTGQDGLPYNDFTCAAAGSDGAVWFGTRVGVVTRKQGEWAYRQGKRWLPHDEVRGIALDEKGQAWIATAGGVGVLGFREMTLAEKADFYEEEMDRYIRRTPYGYVSEVRLSQPGDKKSEVIRHDSDNDGLWTSMYGAGECFAYAATGDPQARKRAIQAFEALRFLQDVTKGGDHPAPDGFVARTIRSTDLPDPNKGRLEHDRGVYESEDKLWKVYEPRWPTSEDGKWYWKSDTSSDELDGHYFFYPLYYDLVAQSETEKEQVRHVVAALTDHLIKYGFNLVDHTGTPTRWGVYAPEDLNHNPNWWSERGLKSLSLLSYLIVAHHVTGDKIYRDHFDRLVEDHGYDTNAMIYKIHRGIGSGNQSDDEMAFMCYYNLIKYLEEGELRDRMLFSFYSAWAIEQPEMNPFFNFAFAAHALNQSYTDIWGTYPVVPWEGWLEDSMATLMGFPLDRLDWGSLNSHRLDIAFLPRQHKRELTDPELPRHGLRQNGKVLPVENRHFNHWNTNPWALDYGGNGDVLASGTVFLLPYYMGLYHGFIKD